MDAERHTPHGTSNINTMWEHIRTAYMQTSETCLRRRQKKRKERITAVTWQAIENRRALKKKVRDTRSERLKERYRWQYQGRGRALKRMTRVDKRAYIEDLANQAEEAANKGELGQAYKITKLVSGKYAELWIRRLWISREAYLPQKQNRRQDGQSILEVLNRPPPTTKAEVEHPDNDLDVSIAPPEKEETMATIRSLKNGKSQDRTASMQNSSKQSQSLQHKFFSHALQQYGRRNNYLMTGQRVSS